MAEEELRIQCAMQCAPVLAEIKVSNLLILEREDSMHLQHMLDTTGLSCAYLYTLHRKSIWLVYWRSELKKILSSDSNRLFLARLGYREYHISAVLRLLKQRCRQYAEGTGEYPHELGILLGYPLADVEGYIAHKGKDYLCSGYWIVYENEAAARNTFHQYRQVRKEAARLARTGMHFRDLMLFFRETEKSRVPANIPACW